MSVKSLNYRRAASIEEYLLHAQDSCRALLRRRAPMGRAVFRGVSAALEPQSPRRSLTQGEIYEGIRFDPPHASEPSAQ